MQIVIEISDFDKDWINYGCHIPDGMNLRISEAIKNGTPLPKWHGRLIDAEAYRKEMLDSKEFDFFKRLDMQPTIIPADKDEK